MMPVTLTLIRHGESESNVAKREFEKNRPLEGERELMAVHTSQRRLTPKGVEQAKKAGEWLRTWLAWTTKAPPRCYVSPYVRAIETAGHLKLGQTWRRDMRLCKRNWGEFDQMPYDERLRRFGNEIHLRKEHAFFWRPADGETMQDVFLRVRDLVTTLHRECDKMHVVVVSHGETMWVWRTILEYWMPDDLSAGMLLSDKRFNIHNCRIIQYTRGALEQGEDKKLSHVRFINPSHVGDPMRNTPWIPITRKLPTDAELLEYAEEHSRFLQAS